MKHIIVLLITSLLSSFAYAEVGVQISAGNFEYTQKPLFWDSQYGAHSTDRIEFDDISPAIRVVKRLPSGLEFSAGIRSAGNDVHANVGATAQADIDTATASETTAKDSLATLLPSDPNYDALKTQYETEAANASALRASIYDMHRKSNEQIGVSLQAMYFKPFGKAKVGAGVEYFKSSDYKTTVAKVAVKAPKTNGFGAGFELIGNGDFVGVAFTGDF